MDHVENVVAWIRNYFEENGKGCKAVVGISGGTDSSVVAALLVKALGKENVIGVLMPNGDQHDIDVSRSLVELLGIKYHEINIKGPVDALREEFKAKLALDPNDYDVYKTNTPARIRMTTLYGISAIYGGRVANTCNLSEDYVGYSTKFGDAAGDFSPKIPEDGMSGKSDEEKLGFTYEMLDKYIRTGVIEDEAIKAKIDRMHKLNLHKIQLMPSYKQGK